MYIDVLGRVSPCWKSMEKSPVWSNDNSLMDIWNGEFFDDYRSAVIENDYSMGRCGECSKDMHHKITTLADAYSGYPMNDYPSVIEMELSNQCNLECVMCWGQLSSGIRKNRDKLPPQKMMYDDSFVVQMREFIPHLSELRINGGEPFLQKIVHKILDAVAEINPTLKVVIATNGTVLNRVVRDFMVKCNIHLNISIDSLIPERYEQIRVNGSFEKLMANVDKFVDICHKNHRELVIQVCPMVNNYEEMADFVDFCEDRYIYLAFNTVIYPEHLSLKNVPKEKLEEIVLQWRAKYDIIGDKYKDEFMKLIKQVYAYRDEK